jgi:hypothetical protein
MKRNWEGLGKASGLQNQGCINLVPYGSGVWAGVAWIMWGL